MPCLLRQSHSAPVPSRNPSQGRGFAKSLLHSLPQHPCLSRLPWHPSQHVCYPHPSPSRPPATCGHHHVLLPPIGPIASFRLHSMAQPLPRSGIRYVVPSPFRWSRLPQHPSITSSSPCSLRFSGGHFGPCLLHVFPQPSLLSGCVNPLRHPVPHSRLPRHPSPQVLLPPLVTPPQPPRRNGWGQ